MEIVIEKAGPQDLDAVAELYGAVCDYLADKPFNPGWRRDGFPSREEAEQYLAADGLYIAQDGGKIAGSIALTADPSAEADTSGARADDLYIHELAVHPDYLRLGIGSMLLDFAAKEAVRRGAESLLLYVWEDNGPAVRTYEKSGFVCLGREDIGLGEFGLNWFYLYKKRLD